MGIIDAVVAKVEKVQAQRAETREFEAWWVKAKDHPWWSQGSDPKGVARGIWDHMREAGKW